MKEFDRRGSSSLECGFLPCQTRHWVSVSPSTHLAPEVRRKVLCRVNLIFHPQIIHQRKAAGILHFLLPPANEVWGKVIFSEARPPSEEAPPPRRRPSPPQSMLGDMVNARAVRILLECNLVFFIKLFWLLLHI